MAQVIKGPDVLRKHFAGLTEYAFHVELGVADPPLVDYLANLLVRFVRLDAIFKLRDIVGRRLEEVADMLLEAEQCEDHPRREFHRHIGDFTLFWTGVYPEALKKLKGFDRKDAMIDYQEQGKRSYLIASTLFENAEPGQSALMRKLSDEFEVCSNGLRRVRAEWERLPS